MSKSDEEIIEDLKKDMEGYEPFAYDEDNYTGEEPEDDMDDEDVQKSMEALIDIEKADTKKGLVFGWASVIKKDGIVVSDRQGDEIDDEWSMEKAAYDFTMSSRVGGEEHVRKGVSTLVESMAFTDEKIEALGLPDDFKRGWWVGFQITDNDVLKGMKEGKYTQFSVHGKGKRMPISKAKKSDSSVMSYNDRREAVSIAVKAMYPSVGLAPSGYPYSTYSYVNDMGDDWVVYNVEMNGVSKVYQAGWSIDEEGDVTITDPFEVRAKTAYVKKGDYDSDAVAAVLSRSRGAMKGR